MIISSPQRVPLLPAADFAAAAQRWFGPSGRVVADRALAAGSTTVQVDPPGEPGFTVDLSADGVSVHVDGTPEQDARVAAWVRSLLPAGFPRLIGFDAGWTWHVELVPGITAEQVLAGRVSHDDPGWAEGDPDLA